MTSGAAVNIEGATGVYVAAGGELIGVLVLDDPIRPETPRVIRSLRRAGVARIVMVTGDHAGVADMVGAAIGVDAVLAERSPAEKVDAVAEERADAQRDPRDGGRRPQRRPGARVARTSAWRWAPAARRRARRRPTS